MATDLPPTLLVPEAPSLPAALAAPADGQRLLAVLGPWMRASARKLNALARGSATARDGLAASAPTAGAWARGDVVTNSAPAELGSTGAKYVIQGWICTASGTPGTWVQQRTLTGN
ncbi:hypothetical protein [Pseudaquabacterium rugosum]|jgi:hypothetical protein|uniref:Chitin-binding type-3 domain-containing protein n=1 Tax=Pseudaquabacterium rugosum TaxID=2984194 RepID=A0ABU9B8C7_9BURK